MKPVDPPTEELDVVHLVLQQVVAVTPGFTDEHAALVEREVRARYGGLRARIQKRGKYKTREEKERAYEDALTAMPTPELLKKHKISLSSLKRLVKTGPGA